MKRQVLFFLSLAFCLFTAAQDSTKVVADTTKKFKPGGVLGGLFFGDYASKIHADELKRGNLEYSGLDKGFNAFNIRRIYVSYDYNFSEKFQSQLVLAYEGFTPVTSTRNVFIKYMNVRWKNIFKRSDLVFGQLPTPTFFSTERLWGLRFIEKTIADQRGISPSSDMGIALQGKLNKAETIGYTVMVGNGTGTRPENDKYKKYYSELNFSALQKKLVIDLIANYEDVNPKLGVAKKTVKAGIIYQVPKYRIGGEVLLDEGMHMVNILSQTSADTLRNAKNQNSFGISMFGVRNINAKLSAFARYDFYNSDISFTKTIQYISPYNLNRESFITAGIDYQPIDRIHISPNIWYDHFHNKQNIANGNNYDLVARLTVFVTFR